MPRCQHAYVGGQKRCNYPAHDVKEHPDVEPHHDEKIKNAVLENRSYQTRHARLALIGLDPKGKYDNANKGNDVCNDVRFLDVSETVGDRYQRARPATCMPTRTCQGR